MPPLLSEYNNHMTTEGPDIGPVDALVLAGGINRIQFYQGYRPGYKALLPFGCKPSLRYVLDALEGVPQLGRRVVVGRRSRSCGGRSPIQAPGNCFRPARP